MRHPNANTTLLPCLVLALALGTRDHAFAVTPQAGTAELSIRAEGGTVQVVWSAPALTLVGFAGAPGNPGQEDDLRLARENLKTGDGLVRFNAQARCVLEEAKTDGDPSLRQGQADLGATYRFGCSLPDALSSAALGFFVGFPALERVHVRYTTARGQGAATLTPRNPVVNFVPLQ
jgi:hypothetical protein